LGHAVICNKFSLDAKATEYDELLLIIYDSTHYAETHMTCSFDIFVFVVTIRKWKHYLMVENILLPA